VDRKFKRRLTALGPAGWPRPKPWRWHPPRGDQFRACKHRHAQRRENRTYQSSRGRDPARFALAFLGPRDGPAILERRRILVIVPTSPKDNGAKRLNRATHPRRGIGGREHRDVGDLRRLSQTVKGDRASDARIEFGVVLFGVIPGAAQKIDRARSEGKHPEVL
jgi:hypothetical protein